MAYMAVGSLILSILYGTLSFWLTIDGKEVELPLIDFSVQADQKLDVLIVQSVVLLALLLVCGILDLKLTAAKRSEEHTSELQSLMRISYAVFCLKKNKQSQIITTITRLP